MQITTILFDIDKTLFNTNRFIEITSLKLQEFLRCTEEEFITARDEFFSQLRDRPRHYHPYPPDFLKHIATHFSVDLHDLTNVYFNPDNFTKARYSETVEALQLLSNKYTLGIFSEGYTDFQIRKLEELHLLSFFPSDLLFISTNKLLPENLASIPPNAVVVDDNQEILQVLIEYHQPCIWINRGNKTAETQAPEIHSLLEIESTIQTYFSSNDKNAS